MVLPISGCRWTLEEVWVWPCGKVDLVSGTGHSDRIAEVCILVLAPPDCQEVCHHLSSCPQSCCSPKSPKELLKGHCLRCLP